MNGLTIISEAEKPLYGKCTFWKVRCNNCENIFVTPSPRIRLRKIHRCKACKPCSKISATAHIVLCGYRARAKKAGLDFTLAPEKFLSLIQSNCYYCLAFPANMRTEHGKSITYNGIDRVDSGRGYTEDNCVACCKICNLAKNDLSQPEFLIWADRIHNHQHESEPVTYAIGHS